MMLEEISLPFISLSLALAVNTLKEGSTWLPEELCGPVDHPPPQCGEEADAELLQPQGG